jgi:hypothetical protein
LPDDVILASPDKNRSTRTWKERCQDRRLVFYDRACSTWEVNKKITILWRS